MDPIQAAAVAGLDLVERTGLDASAPVVALAEAIRDGTASDGQLLDAWDQYQTVVAQRPALAGVAWLCMGGLDGLSRARVAAQSQTLTGRMERMSADLSSLSRLTRARVETALQSAADRGADRAGRVATRNIRNRAVRTQLESQPPREALAAVTAAGLFPAVEAVVADVFASTVEDAVSAVRPVLTSAQDEATAIIGEALFTIPEPGDRWATATVEAVTCLESRFLVWLAGLTDPGAVPAVPAGLVSAVIEAASGAVMADGGMAVRTEGGDTQGESGTLGVDGIALGPIGVDLIRESLAAWAPQAT